MLATSLIALTTQGCDPFGGGAATPSSVTGVWEATYPTGDVAAEHVDAGGTRCTDSTVATDRVTNTDVTGSTSTHDADELVVTTMFADLGPGDVALTILLVSPGVVDEVRVLRPDPGTLVERWTTHAADFSSTECGDVLEFDPRPGCPSARATLDENSDEVRLVAPAYCLGDAPWVTVAVSVRTTLDDTDDGGGRTVFHDDPPVSPRILRGPAG